MNTTLVSFEKVFAPGNSNWSDRSEYNRIYLQTQQNYFNDRLKAKGFVFLNEVYRALGFPETKSGQTHGWIMDPRDPYRPIDFHVTELSDHTISLQFDTDGDILDHLTD